MLNDADARALIAALNRLAAAIEQVAMYQGAIATNTPALAQDLPSAVSGMVGIDTPVTKL